LALVQGENAKVLVAAREGRIVLGRLLLASLVGALFALLLGIHLLASKDALLPAQRHRSVVLDRENLYWSYFAESFLGALGSGAGSAIAGWLLILLIE
jgi:hypothetical protein